MMTPGLQRTADALSEARTPFVVATVVRCARPASARPGDAAIVHTDGRIEGFVGGACASSTVRLHALRVLETHEPLLLRITPGGVGEAAEAGAVTVANPCLSGGELEIFLEPHLPAPRLRVLGDSPVGEALRRLGEPLGYLVEQGGAPRADDAALVVASHGQGDETAALGRALSSGVPYVGLVASPRRGAAAIESVRAAGIEDEELARLHTPAGLDIGSRTHAEVALSILAELVALRTHVPLADIQPVAGGAVDPVCGMVEPPGGGWQRIEHDGQEVAFCCSGCRKAFETAPEQYAAST
jgi:xanthine dehydrogenase accessory factor